MFKFSWNGKRDNPLRGFYHVLIPYKWWKLVDNCKKGLMEVSKCLLRFKVCKDMRIYIAKCIWETRGDYLWLMKKHKHTHKRLCHNKVKKYF